MISVKTLKTYMIAITLCGALPLMAMDIDVPTRPESWTSWAARVSGINLAKRALQRSKTAVTSLPRVAQQVIQENRDAVSAAAVTATSLYIQPELTITAIMAALGALTINTVFIPEIISDDTTITLRPDPCNDPKGYIKALIQYGFKENKLLTAANCVLVALVTYSSGITSGSMAGATNLLVCALHNDRIQPLIAKATDASIVLKDYSEIAAITALDAIQHTRENLPNQLRLYRDPITLGATGLAAAYLIPVALRVGIDAAISSCTGIVIHQVVSGSELKKLITSAAGSTATFLVLFFGTNVGASVIDPTGIVLAGGAIGTMCALHPDRAQHALEQAGTYTGNAIRATKDFLVRHKIDGLLALGGLGTIYALLRNNGELTRQLVTNVNTANTAICVFEISFNHFEGQNPNPIRSTMSLTDKGQLIPSANSGADLVALTTMLNSDNSEQGNNVYVPIQSENRAIPAVCFVKIHREHTNNDRLSFTISVVRRFDDNSESVMSAAEHEEDPLITLNVTLLSSAGEHKQLTASEAERRILNTIVEVEKDRSFRERVNAQN